MDETLTFLTKATQSGTAPDDAPLSDSHLETVFQILQRWPSLTRFPGDRDIIARAVISLLIYLSSHGCRSAPQRLLSLLLRRPLPRDSIFPCAVSRGRLVGPMGNAYPQTTGHERPVDASDFREYAAGEHGIK